MLTEKIAFFCSPHILINSTILWNFISEMELLRSIYHNGSCWVTYRKADYFTYRLTCVFQNPFHGYLSLLDQITCHSFKRLPVNIISYQVSTCPEKIANNIGRSPQAKFCLSCDKSLTQAYVTLIKYYCLSFVTTMVPLYFSSWVMEWQ